MVAAAPLPEAPSEALAIPTIVPDEIEHIDLPGHYAGCWVELWLNPPDEWLSSLDGMTNAQFLAVLVKAWYFGTDPAPAITEATIQRLPRKLLTYIVDEYWERYNRPLVPLTNAPFGPTTAQAAPSTPDGGTPSATPRTRSRAGSPASTTPNGSA